MSFHFKTCIFFFDFVKWGLTDRLTDETKLIMCKKKLSLLVVTAATWINRSFCSILLVFGFAQKTAIFAFMQIRHQWPNRKKDIIPPLLNGSLIDPRGRPTVTAGIDHYFRTCCLSVRTSVPIFQYLAKQNKVQASIVIATGVNVGLAEWIIDSTMSPLLFLCSAALLSQQRMSI